MSLPRLLRFPLLTAMMVTLTVAARPQPGAAPRLLAVDVLLETDATMIEHARQVNDRLRESYPAGYALDAAHTPHITLVQRYIPESRLPEARAALARLLRSEKLSGLRLTATGYIVSVWGPTALVMYRVEPTPELRRLEAAVDAAIQPFAATGGTPAAFVRRPGEEIDAATVGWVEEFIPSHSGEHFEPHVTLGLTLPELGAKLKQEPFAPFTFHPSSLSIFQLGTVGTAQKKLAGWPLKASHL